MTWEVLFALASFVLPVPAGASLVRASWVAAPRTVVWTFGPLLGFGLAGAAFFLGLVAFDSTTAAFVSSELVLFAALVPGLRTALSRAGTGKPERAPADDFTLWIGAALAAAIALAAVSFVLATSLSPHGGWDAIGIWNMKARIIHRSESGPLSTLTDPWIRDTQTDYPFLLSALIARGWRYSGTESRIVTVGIAAVFLLTLVGIVAFGLATAVGERRAWLVAVVLAGTPFLASHAASLYADVAMGAFMTGAVALWLIRDVNRSPRGILIVAGMLAGFAAATKNEGLLFVVVLMVARALLAFWRAEWRGSFRDLGFWTGGLAVGIVPLVAFKLAASPESPIVGAMTPGAMLDRFANWSFHSVVLRTIGADIGSFGEWWINPIPLLGLYLLALGFSSGRTRSHEPNGSATDAWWTPTLVLAGMAAGFYLVYLFSPYSIEWHVGASASRLLLQLWPIFLIIAATIGVRGAIPALPAVRPGRCCWTLVAGLATVAVLAAVGGVQAEDRDVEPRLELSRTDVVAGEDAYTLRVPGMESRAVEISYRFEGGDEEQMVVATDDTGAVTFEVSADTPRGTYTFTEVRDVATDGEAFPVSGAITVR